MIQHKKLQSLLMSISAYGMQGRRDHMEDYFDIAYQMKPSDRRRPGEWPYEYFYFGIFDGHGGDEAARYAKNHLLKFILRQPDFWSEHDEDVKRAIRQGFAHTQTNMRAEMSTWKKTSKALPSTAGTTASVLFIKNGKFYSGHVGDTRIVISQSHPETSNWISDQLTEDHKPESDTEWGRIDQAGGEVRDKVGVHRVVWKRPVFSEDFETEMINAHKLGYEDERFSQITTYPLSETLVMRYEKIPFLAIARSLGDFWSLNPYSGQYIVSPEPDITCRPIDPNDTCILLATDGIWNVMNSPTAGRFLQELSDYKPPRHRSDDDFYLLDNYYRVLGPTNHQHALSLVYLAYQRWERRGLRSDNISAITVLLSDLFHQVIKKNEPETSSCHPSPESIENDTVQIASTRMFDELIFLGEDPKFKVEPLPKREFDFLERLNKFIVLPPTVVMEAFRFDDGYVDPPMNYTRLSYARVREIKNQDEGYAIYLKRVSDDPSDRRRIPSRKNKAGKSVRDSSAQATQPLHDFGQPWDELKKSFDYKTIKELDKDVELVFEHELRPDDIVVDDFGNSPTKDFGELDLEYGGPDDDDDSPIEYSSSPDTSDSDDDSSPRSPSWHDGDDSVLIDDDDGLIDTKDTAVLKINVKESNQEKIDKGDDSASSIAESPKSGRSSFRCLMNYDSTPQTSRRITRSGTYLSATENPKRSLESDNNSPKMKRRKSHPIQCPVAQA